MNVNRFIVHHTESVPPTGLEPVLFGLQPNALPTKLKGQDPVCTSALVLFNPHGITREWPRDDFRSSFLITYHTQEHVCVRLLPQISSPFTDISPRSARWELNPRVTI